MDNKIKSFRDWVTEKINIEEQSLGICVGGCEYALYIREPMRKQVFESYFRTTYMLIDDDISVAQVMAREEQIPSDVLDTALMEFKQMKSKVRKIKATYKKALSELKEEIEKASENVIIVQKTETVVEQIVREWCSSHEIILYLKEQFENEELLKTIETLSKLLLSSKLCPSNEEIREFVERYMKQCTIDVA